MGDNSGPGRRKKCVGPSLVDLSDIEGFDNTPINNKVYGLEFANGIYRRKSIEEGTNNNNNNNNLLDTSIGVEDKIYGFKFKNNAYTQEIIKPYKLEELSNVEFQDVEPNQSYQLVKNSIGSWFLMKNINWIIDVSVTPKSLFVGKQNRLKKIMNNGTALISYIPNRKNSIYIFEQENNYYIKRNNDVDNSTPVFLTALQEFENEKFEINDNSTIVMEIHLLSAPNDFVQLLPGVIIKWTETDENKSCFIFLRGTNQSGATLSSVTFQIEKPIKIDRIGTNNNFYFKKLLYVNEKLPMEYLRTLYG